MVCQRKLGNSMLLLKENGVACEHDRWHTFLGKRREGILDFLRAARLDRYQRKAGFLGGVLRTFADRRIGRAVWIPEKPNPIRSANRREQFQLFRSVSSDELPVR
jgi:hypothetical protein